MEKPRVSVRIRKVKEFFAHGTKGIAKHDFRGYTDEDRPSYIDPEESWLNKELLGRVKGNWEEIYQQLCLIELQQRQKFEELKKRGIIPKNQGWKKRTPAFVSGIITFSKEAQLRISKIPMSLTRGNEDIPEEFMKQKVIYPSLEIDENGELKDVVVEEMGIELIDRLAIQFIREFEKKYGARAVYLVRHLDETSPHYHFLFENLLDNGKMLSNTFVKPSVIQKGKARPYQRNIQEIQDLAGEIFSRVGIERGEFKEQRLARGKREYIKPISKFKDIKKREEERLYERLRKLEFAVKQKEERVSLLTDRIQELERKKKEQEQVIRVYQEEIERLWKEEQKLEQLLSEYEKKLNYYRNNWRAIVDIAIAEDIEKEFERERQKFEDLERKFEKLKDFIERNYGSYKVKEILEEGWSRGKGRGLDR